ncbi:MAG: methyltransferase domain-containing protein [Terriglobales bacterium]
MAGAEGNAGGAETSRTNVLHFAPEPFFRRKCAGMFRSYTTADLCPDGVDYAVDLAKPLPFAPGSFDLIYASHVLEHIRDDEAALENIRRALSPVGLAILPVPIVAETTIEYPAPNPAEAGHVRAPGRDYYRRYEKYFRKLTVFSSEDFDDRFQLFV